MAPRNLKFAGYVLLLTLVACGNDSYTLTRRNQLTHQHQHQHQHRSRLTTYQVIFSFWQNQSFLRPRIWFRLI